MSYVVMVYVNNGFKEYYLPAINNSDYSLIISKEVFSLQDDICLEMEIINGVWRFVKNKNYRIEDETRKVFFDKALESGKLIYLYNSTGVLISLLFMESKFNSVGMKKYLLNGQSTITIGNNVGNIVCYNLYTYISRTHATLNRSNNGWTITDQSSNGTFVNSTKINGTVQLKFGDVITIFGLKIVFLNNCIAVGNTFGELIISDTIEQYSIGKINREETVQQKRTKKKYFKRSPRNMELVMSDPIEIEGPPAAQKVKQRPLFMTIGPAFTMAIPMILGSVLAIFASKNGGGAYMYTGIITAFASAGLGVFWAITNINYTKKVEKEEQDVRYNSYGKYLIDKAEELKHVYEYNYNVLNNSYVSSRDCCTYNESNSALWNRNFNHEDFLFIRLGKGNIPFQAPIIIPKSKFELYPDELAQKPKMLLENYKTLFDVPVGIDVLKKNLIGIVGGINKIGAIQIVHNMIAQIAVNNCYTDVKLVFLCNCNNEEKEKQWSFTRWLPHVWSDDKKIRYVAFNKLDVSDVCYELAQIFRNRAENEKNDNDSIVRPHYVVFVEDMELLEGELLYKYLMEPKKEYGLTTVLMTEKYQDLPNMCEDIIQNDGVINAVYNVTESSACKQEITYDSVNVVSLDILARNLTGIEVNDGEVSSEIPNSLDFLDMYGISRLEELNVVERWTKNRTYDSMKALIGKKGGGTDCYLDIHEKYHGPHGLVAGTTGSGKSETLQTYMLSLAVSFSPDDIGFFIIDFKGGGMANLFSNLPHLIGQISNLSGNQVHRAMISIKSENLRRQRIFTENNVNNINNYTRLYKSGEAKTPVPHLFIIIDEFAELKREHPDFMKELISVAQVGRSLGVHLILATQKPSGTVDDNIWSNSKFRLCLRVQDRQDSNDMLHKPDAAYITQAGRCYLQVGNDEVYELFQSGYSGATYDESGESKMDIATMISLTGKQEIISSKLKKKLGSTGSKNKTQLDAVVDYLGVIARTNGYNANLQLWLPVLPTSLQIDKLKNYLRDTFDGQYKLMNSWNLKAYVGLYDDPENQAQEPVIIDFAEGGHHAILGTISTGKSTFLQTMIFSMINMYTPDWLNIYIMDFSNRALSCFANDAHVGGILYDSDIDTVGKFFNMLNKIMDERKILFEGTNYNQYVKVNGIKVPSIVVVIDNYAGFKEKTDGMYENSILRLSREGVGLGIFLCVTAAAFGSNDLPNRIGDNIKTSVALEMGDKLKMQEALRISHVDNMPEVDIKGRGLISIDGRILEFQTALSYVTDDDYARTELIKARCEELNSVWNGNYARKIPFIPEKPIWSEYENNDEYRNLIDNDMIPIGYNEIDASYYGINLRYAFTYLFSGRPKTGRKNLLKLAILGAKKMNAKIYIIDMKEKNFVKLSETVGATLVNDNESLYNCFADIYDLVIARNKIKNSMLEDGIEEDEIFRRMNQEQRIFIFIADMASFIESTYKLPSDMSIAPFVENITDKGYLHNLFFIGCNNTDDYLSIANKRIYANMSSHKMGVHLGGNIGQQKIFNFSNIAYTNQNKNMPVGMGLAANPLDNMISEKIIIPVVKGL